MNKLHLGIITLLLTSLSVPAAQAQEGRGWSASLGVIDFTRSQQAVELGIDHRWSEWRWRLRPIAGVHVTADESIFGYVGLRRSYRLGDSRWSFVPSFAVSVYERGNGKDLGHDIEFRSGADLLFDLPMGGRAGIGFYHLSNGTLSDENPGTNSLLLRYQLPGRLK
jgi:hypothetical protein